jgi:hypothetical protein
MSVSFGFSFRTLDGLRVNLLLEPLTPVQTAQVAAELAKPKFLPDGREREYTYSEYNLRYLTANRRSVGGLTACLTSSVMSKKVFNLYAQGQLLSVNNIDAMLAYLNQYEIEYWRAPNRAWSPGPPRTLWLDSGFMVGDEANFGDKTLNTEFNRVRYVGTIINTSRPVAGSTNGVHWVTYVAKYNHRNKTYSLAFYDSLAGGAVRLNSIVSRFNTVFRGVTYTHDGVVNVMACPVQPNEIDCGVFALANAFFFSANPSGAANPYLPAAAAQFRQVMAFQILQGSNEVVLID